MNYIGNYKNEAIIAFSFLLLFSIFMVSLRSKRKMERNALVKQHAQAAALFRNKVLEALKGLYPIPRYLKPEDIDKFRKSVPIIASAAADFSTVLSQEEKNAFDTALKNYSKHCKEITWESCASFGITAEERKEAEKGPKEIFRQNVNALLAFTKQQKKS